ncbi:helicase C-terminal domain-containing protein [Desulfosporosinus sp. PR]|uniref:helicase C-terminal domain-containing protein n=1 Tax=Candidatus Desulfosporosinus nitrosoreducens TaxID=3401928 RepID=UPI0027F1D571|nr:helicase C-terminal domain-containing protein [Desulfosporosinus sp. PR]MDQ7093956.1 helicase C-terminal domain-containing protein [Desulfosporosinus sp. PR]
MRKDVIFLNIEKTVLEGKDEEIFEFTALRIHDGQLPESCCFFVCQEQPYNPEAYSIILPQDSIGVLSLPEYRQKIRDFFDDAVLVSHCDASYLRILERALNAPFPNIAWDTTELARIFFPSLHHYQLPYLAEELRLSGEGELNIHPSEQKVHLIWKLFEACRNKGLGFDLSFFDQAQAFLAGWSGKSFFDDLRREIIRQFPDRRIQTDLVLSPSPEGLFAQSQNSDQKIPDSLKWISESFSEGGILEQSLPGYECRPGQTKMAQLIAEGFISAHHVVIEAGTGTGKSFAYLIPSLWFARKTGRKVVVATHTIPLQEQLQKKDIPMLAKVLPFSFRTSVLKGKGNYCCLKRWLSCLTNPQEIAGQDQKLAVLSTLVWLRETRTGDIQELSKVPGLMSIWPDLSADNELCNPGKCSKSGVCFLLRARKKAEEADVLIVNHSLLFSDLKTDYNVLPEYHHLVLDEAHQVYQTALQNLGSELCFEVLTRTLETIYRQSGANFYTTTKLRLESFRFTAPVVSWDIFAQRLDNIPELCLNVLTQGKELFQLLEAILGLERTFRFVSRHTSLSWWSPLLVQFENLIGRLKSLVAVMQSLTSVLNGEEADEVEELSYVINTHQRELQEIQDTLALAINIADPRQVTWLERSSRLYLKTSPLEVSDILKEKIFSRLDTVILTSATLSIANSFNHFLQDIGLPLTTKTAAVDSPFNFDAQMQFFVLNKGLNAVHSDEEKVDVLSELILNVAERMQGRTLVLFTAHKLLRETYADLKPRLTKLNIDTLAQGIQGERTTLLETFKRNPKSVLLGANSFWEGIDIPGETLSCVILVKLPFWPPSLPLIEARSEFLKAQGRDPFREFLLPEAVIRFKQGFGRLIRSKEDRGFVILLDDRVIGKYYGRYFLSSLPIRTHFRADDRQLFQKISDWKFRELM